MGKPYFSKRRSVYKKLRIEDGLTHYAAAIKAGYSEAVARHKKITIPSMAEALELAGLSDKRLAEIVVDGCSAEKSNGDKDHYARHKYVETAAKLKGHLSEKATTNVEKMQVNVYLPAPQNSIDSK